ncbi:hypothetical protein V2G26_002580 [Clonostachys chloroleuca]|uniref:AB hydrolase-1 domain-containing protein n=1 Tax=Clonostachys chloroleuca TaxID=1926264 RepID=A0AA35M2M6_9HYPO|nr:unnamed protein product [Clonostachys chloroleuca]
MSNIISYVSSVDAGGSNMFYRYAAPTNEPEGTILLLHGFPSSSHQFRNLIPRLAGRGYKVIAPDLPGYGFTTVPDGYNYTFADIAATIELFVSALLLQKIAIYIFDYGAPTGLRYALNNPDNVVAIISQNGNAYVEGFGTKFWAPIRKYWETGSIQDRNALQGALELDSITWQYTNGSPHPEKIQPESYWLDHALVEREGNRDIQLDLLYDYRKNIDLYPAFQEYFRTSEVPVLAIWGKNDEIFIPPGAKAFKKDVKNLELHLIDAGHFAIETNEDYFANEIDDFLRKGDIFG